MDCFDVTKPWLENKCNYLYLLDQAEDLQMKSLMNNECDKVLGGASMIDYDQVYPGTMQEVMFELKLNTDKLLKKFIEQAKRV